MSCEDCWLLEGCQQVLCLASLNEKVLLSAARHISRGQLLEPRPRQGGQKKPSVRSSRLRPI